MSVKDAIADAYYRRKTASTSPHGIDLPPERYRMGGRHFLNDADFVNRAKQDVAKLVEQGLRPSSRLLDWGCGAGRLAVGLLETWPDFASYTGIDVQQHLIMWADRHLARPGIEFRFTDMANERYNPDGNTAREIAAGTEDFDAVHAYSVLSHMSGNDVAGYLTEIRRVLRQGGFAWVTAFIEDDVADEEENPPGYGPLEWAGPLHCVRFERGFFAKMVLAADLTMTIDSHGAETDGQTAIVLRPR